uniref:WxxW domain-containing protein n=1 Tax=Parastrongyloides trichosuri TaxID=131310 RepID=A0A0N4ZPC0_PARTI
MILLILLIFILTGKIKSSQCGNGTIPFSFEALEDGQMILGCAKTTCLSFLPNGIHTGNNIKFWKIDGHPDGYLRSQDFKKNDIYVSEDKKQQSIVKCEDGFNSKHCGKFGEWVGGIKPTPYEKLVNTSLKLKCCSYDKLYDSFDQGVGEINPGQIIVGGEIFKNGIQVAFEYIADIHKKIDSGRILYIITTRRFKCLRGSQENKKIIGRRKLKKINVVMRKEIKSKILDKNLKKEDKIKKEKITDMAFIKLLEEIQLTENAITMNKNVYRKNSSKKEIRKSPGTRKNINFDIVEVNENNRNSKPRYQAYWDVNENRWKYKTFLLSKGNNTLPPDDDSVISEAYNEKDENNEVPPIPITVKPKLRKPKYEPEIYVKIPKRVISKNYQPTTKRLTIPTTTYSTIVQSTEAPESTINWFGQQLVPGKTYKVFDTLSPELSYEFTVPEIFKPLATPPPPPGGGQTSAPINIFAPLSNHPIFNQPTTFEQAIQSLSSSPVISNGLNTQSSNIRRSPIIHDIIPTSLPIKRDIPLSTNKPSSNIIIEEMSPNNVKVISSQKNLDEIIPEGGRLILNKIARTLLGEYYNRLML